MSQPVFRQARRPALGRRRIPVPVVVADLTTPDGTLGEVVVRECKTTLDANNTAHVLATCNLDALRCALNQDADGIAAEAARLRSALVRLMLPYEALLADQESRRWICTDIWANMTNAVNAARRAVLGEPEVEE